MVAIKLSAIVGEDRQLNIKLPDDFPVGSVLVEIRSTQLPSVTDPTSPREIARAQLMAAGVLVLPEEMGIPDDVSPLNLEERLDIGKLPSWARPSEELIDEDRGEW